MCKIGVVDTGHKAAMGVGRDRYRVEAVVMDASGGIRDDNRGRKLTYIHTYMNRSYNNLCGHEVCI